MIVLTDTPVTARRTEERLASVIAIFRQLGGLHRLLPPRSRQIPQ